jgi:hypothetical protein
VDSSHSATRLASQLRCKRPLGAHMCVMIAAARTHSRHCLSRINLAIVGDLFNNLRR